MSLDLTHLIESAADEVASVGRAAAGSLNDLVHDWGHETRAFVSDHAHSLPMLPSTRRGGPNLSFLRFLIPALVLGAVAFVVLKKRRSTSTPYLPERNHSHDEVRESAAEGAAAS